MKILMVNKAYYPLLGGVETVAKQIAENAAKQDLQVELLCMGQSDEESIINNVKVTRVATQFKVGSALLSTRFNKIFRNKIIQNDLIHFHYPNPAGEIAWLTTPKKFRKEKIIICTYHNDPVKPKFLVPAYNLLTRLFLKSCHYVIATSPNYINTSKNLSYVKEKCQVIPLGVNTDRFKNIQQEIIQEVETRLENLKHPRILFTGRLVYYKGIEFVIEALSLTPGVSAVIVGNGPEKERLIKLSKKLNVDDRVVFLDPLSDEQYPAVFKCCDAFILPSVARTEAFGIVVLEAMAAGLPLITTEIGTGTSYHNQHLLTGYIVPPADKKELSKAIRKLFSDSNHAHNMGQKATMRVESEFQESNMISKYMKIFLDLKYNPKK